MKLGSRQKASMFFFYYTFAVLPVMFIFLYFYQGVSVGIEEEILNSSYQNLAHIADGINNDINEALDIANRIYANRNIQTMLTQLYDTPAEYYAEYHSTAVPYLYALTSLDSKIEDYYIYVDNPTIFDGGLIRRLDLVELNSPFETLEPQKDGYEMSAVFLELSGSAEWVKDAHTIPEEGRFIISSGRYYPHKQSGMLFSFVRDISAHNSDITALIKLDFETDFFRNAIATHDYRGIICVVDSEGRFVATNGPAEVWSQYMARPDADRYIQSVNLANPYGYSIVGYSDIAYITSRLGVQRNLAMLLIALSGLMLLLVVYRLVNQIFAARLQETQIELRQKQAEFAALKNQVDPHFLFNILETVRMKLFLAGEKTHAVTIMRMARLYRKILNWDTDVIPLSEEIDFIHEFLEIQKYRYEGDLVYNTDIDNDLKGYKVPKMLLQTFVENACKHGLNESGVTELEISVKIKNQRLHFMIKDNGKGFKEEEKKRVNALLNAKTSEDSGIGIANAIQRMRLYYGGDFSFAINSQTGQGATIAIVLPANLN